MLLRSWMATFVAVTLWINLSEIFRYFVFVMPMTRATLFMVPDVAPMNLPVFLVWGVWDTILTVIAIWIYRLHEGRFGATRRAVVLSGTTCWALLFLLFWIAMLNMNLARLETALIALPLAWVEMIVAALIAQWSARRSA
ncbi:hypothetical protein [Candidatus Raskinella chloraquaticus]|jgi:hypothetical protein|uniref:Uncharacterized protein n=1 Tax=Candidatus Raskinella chloraquaticus TaxID=1951219 RepID=A0A1W9HRQ2_9HYPH|nr:MAG: hypothetical protein A4S15_13765 [Proteobacteria bacterium SG_bin8]